MLEETIKKFYEVYEIEPSIKKGDTYIDGNFRLAQVTAEEDIMPKLYDYTYLRLLAYLSQNQDWERFELPSCGTGCLKECILDWYLRNKHMVNLDKVKEIVNAPMNVEVI